MTVAPGKPRTLKDALDTAERYWHQSARSSAGVQTVRAGRCIECVKGKGTRALASLGEADGVALLGALSAFGLSRKSVADYYATFRRMLKLSGVETYGWPKAPVPERKKRPMLGRESLDLLCAELERRSFGETASLLALLRGTGIRVGIEGLTRGAIQAQTNTEGLCLITITGKGGHQRVVPVVDPKTILLVTDPARMASIQRVPYRTHLWRIAQCCKALGIPLATPHALRHSYATEALKRSGGNLKLVQELLGHNDPATTAIYAEVGMDEKVKALRNAEGQT